MQWLFIFPSSHSAYANQLLKEPVSSCAWWISHPATRDNDWISTGRLKISTPVHIRSNQLLIPPQTYLTSPNTCLRVTLAWQVFSVTRRLLLLAPHCTAIIYGARWKAKRKDELRFSRVHIVLTCSGASDNCLKSINMWKCMWGPTGDKNTRQVDGSLGD